MIWLVGNSSDPKIDVHTHALERACARAGVDSRFLGPGCDLNAEMRIIKPDDVIVWRYKLVPPSYPQSTNSIAYRFSAIEWREALFGFCKSSKLAVLNGYDAITVAGNKPYQLSVAESSGFNIPRYAILNNKAQALHFLVQLNGNSAIRKPLAGYDIPDPADSSKLLLLAPVIVSLAEIHCATEESLSRCPTLFQEYVEKEYELRIVAVGGSIIAFKVDSQASEHTRLDWRMGILSDMFSQVEIDESISRKIRIYLKKVGLFSGVFDFIVQPNGNLVFLECNPNGQWMWLDYLNPDYIADTFIYEVRNFQQTLMA